MNTRRFTVKMFQKDAQQRRYGRKLKDTQKNADTITIYQRETFNSQNCIPTTA